tara:strand:- start:2644 stop:3474 length:831 start_codon:yes stop_codon:yes gene_type:complete
MCDPVSGAMAFMSVMQVQQEQEAAVQEANAINEAFEENNKMQVDAYNQDMAAYWDEEVNIQEAMHDNAEDAAEAGLAMKIQQKSDVSSMLIANAEQTAGGGGSPTALLGNLRRSQLNAARDLDEEFQAGVEALGGERSALQRDKIARRNQAIGAINSAPRASYQTNESKFMALGMAGASAYVQGQAMQGNNLFGGTAGVTPEAASIGMTGKQRGSFSSMKGSKYKKGGSIRKNALSQRVNPAKSRNSLISGGPTPYGSYRSNIKGGVYSKYKTGVS